MVCGEKSLSIDGWEQLYSGCRIRIYQRSGLTRIFVDDKEIEGWDSFLFDLEFRNIPELTMKFRDVEKV